MSPQSGALRERQQRRAVARGGSRKQSRTEVRGLIGPPQAGMFTLTAAGLADKFSLNMTQQFAGVLTVLPRVRLKHAAQI